MKLIKSYFLLAILATIPLGQAAASLITGFANDNGVSGDTNTTEAQFYGAGATGPEYETMYLRDDAKVSELIFSNARNGQAYILSFNVGYPADQPRPDYIVKVATDNGTMAEVFNPVRPKTGGTFEEVKLQFTNRGVATGLYTISIETQGVGELHFHDFYLSAYSYNSDTPHLKTVAYGHSLYVAQDKSYTCVADYSLSQSDGLDIPFLASQNGDCHCVDSQTILTSETHYPSGDIRSFYQCRTSSR